MKINRLRFLRLGLTLGLVAVMMLGPPVRETDINRRIDFDYYCPGFAV